MPTPTKTCPKCGIAKPATLDHFYKYRSPDGLYRLCKSCYKAGLGTGKPRGAKTPTAKPADKLVAMVPLPKGKTSTKAKKATVKSDPVNDRKDGEAALAGHIAKATRRSSKPRLAVVPGAVTD